ncbi:hypothetical protein BDK51DRAFT_40687 [Blyttiomyces helicus]|uniref:Uncharacterized protein n=1 Tax=Blyttiomyces helicus TaxID=388810 RepID=A0A4P9WF96_9FUNG|nr:hypothetical protein BDK51DRAFT_40687 [Blyttiomyces helicus]|eukprot:RKO89690.1 hypothetical protein BDK51DRAFT_40687 [Blyttiomyces helicus]
MHGCTGRFSFPANSIQCRPKRRTAAFATLPDHSLQQRAARGRGPTMGAKAANPVSPPLSSPESTTIAEQFKLSPPVNAPPVPSRRSARRVGTASAAPEQYCVNNRDDLVGVEAEMKQVSSPPPQTESLASSASKTSVPQHTITVIAPATRPRRQGRLSDPTPIPTTSAPPRNVASTCLPATTDAAAAAMATRRRKIPAPSIMMTRKRARMQEEERGKAAVAADKEHAVDADEEEPAVESATQLTPENLSPLKRPHPSSSPERPAPPKRFKAAAPAVEAEGDADADMSDAIPEATAALKVESLNKPYDGIPSRHSHDPARRGHYQPPPPPAPRTKVQTLRGHIQSAHMARRQLVASEARMATHADSLASPCSFVPAHVPPDVATALADFRRRAAEIQKEIDAFSQDLLAPALNGIDQVVLPSLRGMFEREREKRPPASHLHVQPCQCNTPSVKIDFEEPGTDNRSETTARGKGSFFVQGPHESAYFSDSPSIKESISQGVPARTIEQSSSANHSIHRGHRGRHRSSASGPSFPAYEGRSGQRNGCQLITAASNPALESIIAAQSSS